MSDIESKIRNRQYQSPSRARATVARSSLKARDKQRLERLIEAWENEGVVDHVVAGEPEALEAELVDAATGNGSSGSPSRRGIRLGELPPIDVGRGVPLLAGGPVLRLNLNARVRVRLTIAGIVKLHGARERTLVPSDIIDRQGLWETTLWDLANVLGPFFHMGIAPEDLLIVDNVIEVIDTETGG